MKIILAARMDRVCRSKPNRFLQAVHVLQQFALFDQGGERFICISCERPCRSRVGCRFLPDYPIFRCQQGVEKRHTADGVTVFGLELVKILAQPTLSFIRMCFARRDAAAPKLPQVTKSTSRARVQAIIGGGTVGEGVGGAECLGGEQLSQSGDSRITGEHWWSIFVLCGPG